MTTLQASLLHDRFANVALSLPSKYNLRGAELQFCAAWLHTFAAERLAAGKSTTDDHLTQEAVAWAKRLRAAGGLHELSIRYYLTETGKES